VESEDAGRQLVLGLGLKPPATSPERHDEVTRSWKLMQLPFHSHRLRH